MGACYIINWSITKKICSIGDNHQSGTYVIFLKINKPTEVTFGRYKNRKDVKLATGYYLYQGVALNRNGPNSLGNKINYHLQRSGTKTNSRIRKETLDFFDKINLRYSNNSLGKILTEDIDRVLDSESTLIHGILVFRQQGNTEISLSEIFKRIREYSQHELKNSGIRQVIKNFYFLDQNALNLKDDQDAPTNQNSWINLVNYLLQLDNSVINSITSFA